MGSLKHDTGKSSKTADRLEQSTNVLCGQLHATYAYAYSRTAATNLPFKGGKKFAHHYVSLQKIALIMTCFHRHLTCLLSHAAISISQPNYAEIYTIKLKYFKSQHHKLRPSEIFAKAAVTIRVAIKFKL
jgi:hypothetical protein